MTSQITTVLCGGQGPTYAGDDLLWTLDNTRNLYSPCWMYQKALEDCTTDVLTMLHDDVTIHDPNWHDRIMEQFLISDEVVAVGLGGAVVLGNRNLYRKPYDIRNMARGGYRSNQTDAETHGERFTGACRVAVLDAFLMAIKVEWLRSRGGWPVEYLTHHCLDLWLACEAARCDKEIWMVGASCIHHGGKTSTSSVYKDAAWLQGGSRESDHQLPHRWLATEYSDVLPIDKG